MLALRTLRRSFPRRGQFYTVLPTVVPYSTHPAHPSPQPSTHRTSPPPAPPPPHKPPSAIPSTPSESSAIPRAPPPPTDSNLAGQVESVEITTAPGVELSGHKRQIVASVLDLMQGKVTRQKLAFWTEDCEFVDPLGIVKGKREVEARWWAMKKVVRDVDMRGHCVVKVEESRVEMEVRNRYTLRGAGTEVEVLSRVVVELAGSGPTQKIRRMEDRHDGTLPQGKITEFFRRLGSIATGKLTAVPP